MSRGTPWPLPTCAPHSMLCSAWEPSRGNCRDGQLRRRQDGEHRGSTMRQGACPQGCPEHSPALLSRLSQSLWGNAPKAESTGLHTPTEPGRPYSTAMLPGFPPSASPTASSTGTELQPPCSSPRPRTVPRTHPRLADVATYVNEQKPKAAQVRPARRQGGADKPQLKPPAPHWQARPPSRRPAVLGDSPRGQAPRRCHRNSPT